MGKVPGISEVSGHWGEEEDEGYEGKVKITLDVASSKFYKDSKYDLDLKNLSLDPSKWILGQQLADIYLELVKKFLIVFIEGPFDQDHWEAWTHFKKDMDPRHFTHFCPTLLISHPQLTLGPYEAQCMP